MYISRRMIVPDHRSVDDVFEMAAAIGAEKIKDESHPVEDGITREVAWQVLPGLLLQFAEDAPSLSAFLMVAGDSADQVSDIANRVAAYIESPTFDDLMEVVEHGESENPVDRGRAILKLGIGAPSEPDPRLIHLLDSLISASDFEVRAAVIFSMKYAFWKEFQPLLRKASEAERNPDLREEAQIMMEASVREYGFWNG